MHSQRPSTDDPRFVDLQEQTFARQMRVLREARKMSQAAFAQELEPYGLHYDSSVITRIEKNGNGDPAGRAIRLGEAVAIAHLLATDLNDMLSTGSYQSRINRAEEALEIATIEVESAQVRRAEAADELERLRTQQAEHQPRAAQRSQPRKQGRS